MRIYHLCGIWARLNNLRRLSFRPPLILIFKIIIHVGTNDLKNSSPRHVAERIVDLGNSIIADSPSTKVTISGLICRSDNSSLNEKATQVNKILNIPSLIRMSGLFCRIPTSLVLI